MTVSAGGRHFRKLRKNNKCGDKNSSFAKEFDERNIYNDLFSSILFIYFFRVSRTLPDQTILGIHLDLIKIWTENQ